MTDRAPILVLIGADPRHSHRANEALRIALGIVSGENEVIIVLTGPGAHLLDEDTDDLVDGDDIAKFRATLRALGIPLHVEEEARPADRSWNTDGHPVVLLRPDDVADLMGRCRRSLLF